MFDSGMTTADCQQVRDGTGSLGDGYKYMMIYEQHYDKNGLTFTNSM